MRKSQPAPHIQALTRRLFGEKSFTQWNPGSYHDSRHAMYVAEVVTAVAGRRRREPERLMFLAQVGLLHDADPRTAGTPASVFRTLEWMWVHKETLQDSLQWTDLAFDTALALIARTDFPFDDKARELGTIFDGQSPYGLYRDLLSQLEPSARAQASEDAQMLRFADQCANYCRDFVTASLSVDDLSAEMHKAGRPVSRWDLDTPSFLDTLACDSHWDCRAQRELDLNGRVFSQTELLHLLPLEMRTNLNRNKQLFQRERQAREAFG